MRLVKYSLAAVLLLGCVAQAQAQNSRGDTIYVADRFLSNPAGGARIVAKFAKDSIRAAEFRLDRVVGTTGSRQLRLSDILVSADFDGNGYIAKWTVAGPKSVIDGYVNRIQALVQDPKIIYDFEIRRVHVYCECD